MALSGVLEFVQVRVLSEWSRRYITEGLSHDFLEWRCRNSDMMYEQKAIGRRTITGGHPQHTSRYDCEALQDITTSMPSQRTLLMPITQITSPSANPSIQLL